MFSWLSTQDIRYSMYSEAETFSGVRTFCPSAHRYSYLGLGMRAYFGPADIIGQTFGVQYSISTP